MPIRTSGVMTSSCLIEITLEPIKTEPVDFIYLSLLIIWSTEWKLLADVICYYRDGEGHSSLE